MAARAAGARRLAGRLQGLSHCGLHARPRAPLELAAAGWAAPQLRLQTRGAASGQEPTLGGPDTEFSGPLLWWSKFVQWSYRTFGSVLIPKKTDICNCGADLGAPIPRPELVAREGIEHGSKEWRMQMFGAALYWHVATMPGEVMKDADPNMLRGADVLEVACMRGGGARYLMELMGPRRYLATDSLQEHVDECRKLHPDVPGLEFQRLDAMELAEALPEESFDFIVCVQAASTFGDVGRFVRGAERLLRPGGRLLLCDGLTRQKLGAIMGAMQETGLEQDACRDMSRAVHAAGLCRIPNSISYMRIVARKPVVDEGV